MANQRSINGQRTAPAAPVRRPDPFGGTLEAAWNMQRMHLERRLDSKIDRYRKEGKCLMTCSIRPSPTISASLKRSCPTVTGPSSRPSRNASAKSAPRGRHPRKISQRQATPAELANARRALGEGADHRDVIDRFNAHGTDFSAL
jgi:hypothetical protein